MCIRDRVERFIDMAVTGDAKRFWTGDWPTDRSAILKLQDLYAQLLMRVQPTADEASEGGTVQLRLVKQFRQRLWTYASSDSGRKANPGLLRFLSEVDVHVMNSQAQSSAFVAVRPTRMDDHHMLAPTVQSYFKAFLVTGTQVHDTVIRQSNEYGLNLAVDQAPADRYSKYSNRGNQDRYRDHPNRDRDTDKSSQRRDQGNRGTGQPKNPSHYGPTNPALASKQKDTTKNDPPKGDSVRCNGCGKTHPPPCVLGPEGANHPDWNADLTVPWQESQYGREWKDSGKNHLPWGKSKKDPAWRNTTQLPW